MLKWAWHSYHLVNGAEMRDVGTAMLRSVTNRPGVHHIDCTNQSGSHNISLVTA